MKNLKLDFAKKKYQNIKNVTDKKIKCTSSLQIDIEYLTAYIESHEILYGKNTEYDIDYIKVGLYTDDIYDEIKFLNKLQLIRRKKDFQLLKYILDTHKNGLIEVRYEEKVSGRLYTTIDLHIQNITKIGRAHV